MDNPTAIAKANGPLQLRTFQLVSTQSKGKKKNQGAKGVEGEKNGRGE